jgi:imidazolonepropionase-like amidohydrolase
MKARGVYQLTTLSSLPPGAALDSLRAHLRVAAALGLPLAFGTDAAVIPHGTNAREFDELVSIGLSPAEAIRAATMCAARAVGLEGGVGTLRAGAFADIIGVEGNPLEDLTALRRVKFVMKGGKVFLSP